MNSSDRKKQAKVDYYTQVDAAEHRFTKNDYKSRLSVCQCGCRCGGDADTVRGSGAGVHGPELELHSSVRKAEYC